MITRTIFLLLAVALLSSCGSKYGKVSYREAPKFINVSAYDPKERQRSGRSYTPHNQTALKVNGSRALIARCAKGYELDSKCADFLQGAERQGMKLGAYCFILAHISPTVQADRFIQRLRVIKSSKGLQTREILLVCDADTKSSAAQIAEFIQRIEKLTGTTPIVYLENSDRLRTTLSSASSKYKRIIRRAPYWIALYSNKDYDNPHDLMKAYDIWNTWAIWQFGGVLWENGRSAPKVFRSLGWRAPKYFGNMDRPMERNAFNGTAEEFENFWSRNSWKW
ncbi:MAG: hypothetical protein L7T84_16555 [Akkermansiaceae bacterium]|nr:hypothetical protein [Akkermansiaceae bacterium]